MNTVAAYDQTIHDVGQMPTEVVKNSPGIKLSRWTWDWLLLSSSTAAAHLGRLLLTEQWRWQHSPQSTNKHMHRLAKNITAANILPLSGTIWV